MKWFNNMKIIAKLLVGFLLVSGLGCAVGIFGIVHINRLADGSTQLFNSLNAPMVYITNITENYYKLRVTITESLVENGSSSSMLFKVTNIKELRDQISLLNDDLDKTLMESEKDEVARYKKSIEELYPKLDTFVEYIQKGDRKGASKYLYDNQELSDAFFNVENNLRALSTAQISNAKAQSDSNHSVGDEALSVMTFIIILGLLLSVGIGVYISLVISRPIKELTRIAEQLAVGNTMVYTSGSSNDEIGKLSKAFSNMIINIREQADTVEKIANGDSNIKIVPKSENDVLSKGIAQVVETVNNLMIEINYLLRESKSQNFNAVGDTSKFLGRNQSIIIGINQTLEAVREKIFWYEAMLDSIPYPIAVTDLDLNTTFINKPIEDFWSINRKDVLGLPANTWSPANAERIEKLKNGETRTMFEANEKKFQVDTSNLYDTKGKITGHIEFSQDVTARMRAIDYQKEEVKKLSHNLKLFAEGNLNLNFEVDEGDEYTIEEKNNFTEINKNLSIAIDSISNYIKEISHLLTEISDGNLKINTGSDYKGDFIEIKNSLDTIIESLNLIVGEVNNTSGQVAEGARQVSNGSRDLSQGATEQASSVEELTAAIAEVATQTKSNAINANEANELAVTVKNNAAQGNIHMEEMVKSMEEINESCQNISKIIKVIDEIAFQTNILALNASVEAARAGQQGRGFAVVAEEVRNLAVRSAEAAKETGALIEESLNIAKKGSGKAQQTYEALNTIVSGIEKASDLVSHIAEASEEQANAIAQINRGVEQVSQVVQTNSATAEESAAASEELSNQAERLSYMVGKFVLKDDVESVVTTDADGDLSEEVSDQTESIDKDIDDIEMIKIDLGESEFGKY